jgi:hypothetical protein
MPEGVTGGRQVPDRYTQCRVVGSACMSESDTVGLHARTIAHCAHADAACISIGAGRDSVCSHGCAR